VPGPERRRVQQPDGLPPVCRRSRLKAELIAPVKKLRSRAGALEPARFFGIAPGVEIERDDAARTHVAKMRSYRGPVIATKLAVGMTAMLPHRRPPVNEAAQDLRRAFLILAPPIGMIHPRRPPSTTLLAHIPSPPPTLDRDHATRHGGWPTSLLRSDGPEGAPPTRDAAARPAVLL